MKKINVAELLCNCPSGMELDCYLFNGLEFDHIDTDDEDYPIVCRVKSSSGEYYKHTFTKYGWYTAFFDYAKCVIFPKGETTWDGFVPPKPEFKCGDVVALDCSGGNSQLFIFKEYDDDDNTVCYLFLDTDGTLDIDEFAWQIGRFATEEEKAKLFQAIKDNGYKWNEETKTLEKLVGLKFKIGDRIKSVMSSAYYTVVDIKNNNYFIKSDTEKYHYQVSFENEINYKLVPNKFDNNSLVPFESRVLIRDTKSQKWSPAIWGFYDSDHQDYQYKLVGVIARYCIPYEGNEHLLGKKDDCDEYFKTWK